MLKYLWTKEVFQEVPDEMSLAIAISGCQIRCPGCHSRELWEDKGTPLTADNLEKLLQEHQGITCLLLMGGEYEMIQLIDLFFLAHKKGLKTAWYCGLDMIPKDRMFLLNHLDFLKVGHYDAELGGLNSPTTNQRLYYIEHFPNQDFMRVDITNKLQRKLFHGVLPHDVKQQNNEN